MMKKTILNSLRLSCLCKILCIAVAASCITGCKKRIQTEKIDEPTKIEQEIFEFPLSEKGKQVISFSEIGTDYMFIVYADCSSCIATFLYNLKDMEDEEFNSIIVIVPPNTSQLISYYIKQIGSSILDKVSVVEDDNYLEAPLETYNGKVYRIVNGYPDKCWITKQ